MSTTIITNHPGLGGVASKSPLALPVTSISLPKPIAQHGLLVQAVAARKSAVTVAGVQVKGPTVHSSSSGTSGSSDSTTHPGQFVVQGTINLFGNKDVTAEFDIWHGSPPPGVTMTSAAPSVQRAVIKGSVKLSQLIPSFSETLPGADLSLQDVSIYHQNYLYDPTKGLGYYLYAELVIDSSLGSLSSILSEILAADKPTVRVHADLGPDQSWNSTPGISTLTIEGSFVGHTHVATSGVQITSVGVRLILRHSPNENATRDIEVFGTLNLALPGGGVRPMELDYMLKDDNGTVRLAATLPPGVTWVDPMGVQEFVLSPVIFSSSLSLSDPWNGVSLDITAKFQYQTSIVNFTGSYVPGGTCSLHANIQEFDLASLQQLYETVQHEPLKAPNVDVTIESAVLSIASDKGFSAVLTNVNIAGHGSRNAVLSFSSTGCIIHAELGTVQFGDVTVNSAYVQLDLQLASSSKSSDVTIYGDVRFEALETNVVVHLYPSEPSVVPKRTEWTVYAELMSSDDTLLLSKIEPRLKGTDFDLALKNVLFIAASKDDPDVGTIIPSAYSPKKGVQVFGTVDEIPIFNSLTKSNVTGMVLDASWSRPAGFSLDILLPVARTLTFDKGVTTTPITLSLNMTPSHIDKAKLMPSLQVSAGLYIPVAHSPEPLLFQMILTAMDTNAIIAAELKGSWVDPFGISDEVIIGPDLILQADLDYVTGLSGGLFKGGLAVGNINAGVVVSMNEDPLKMLYTEIDNLEFTDVVSFAEKLLHLKLPPPPSDFLEFDKVKLYICPVGLTIQGVLYPPGFSFKSNMTLFGKRADVSCDVRDSFLSIKGSVEDFEVGPLKVNGLNGAQQAVVQVQVGKDTQHLLLDGAITLYDEIYALHLLVDMQPSPQISLKVYVLVTFVSCGSLANLISDLDAWVSEFKLTELLTFEVDATLIGAPNLNDLSTADFRLNGDLEQHLLDYIRDELLNLFTKAQQCAEEGIEAAKKQVAAEQATLDKRIARAKVQLNVAQARWEAHQKSVTQTNLKIIHDYNARIETLQRCISSTEEAYDAAIRNAQSNLTNARHDRQVETRAAKNDLENVKRKTASDTEGAKHRVAAAKTKMNRDFGSAEKNVENAQRKVEDRQHQIDSIHHEINSLKHAAWFRKIKIAEFEAQLGTLEASLKIARGALEAAQAVFKSASYVAEKSALDAAQKNLDLAEQTGPTLVSDSQRALTSVDQLTQAAVDRASEALCAIESGSEKIVFDGAKGALAAYKRTDDVVFEDANKAVADLVQSVEYVAFEAATTALATAQGATKGLDTARHLLSEAEKGGANVLSIGKAIISAGADALNITSVHLSGTLGKSIGGAGLMADVKGVALRMPFKISIDLDPSKVENFLTSVFQELKRDMKVGLHV